MKGPPTQAAAAAAVATAEEVMSDGALMSGGCDGSAVEERQRSQSEMGSANTLPTPRPPRRAMGEGNKLQQQQRRYQLRLYSLLAGSRFKQKHAPTLQQQQRRRRRRSDGESRAQSLAARAPTSRLQMEQPIYLAEQKQRARKLIQATKYSMINPPRRSCVEKSSSSSWHRQLCLLIGSRQKPPFFGQILMIIILILGGNFIRASGAVDCFKCSSRNGSNPACEDPFHNLNTTRITSPVLPDPQPNVIYHTPCYAGKKGKEGLFPASACIKLTGTFDATGETLVVRHCALDSGTLTQDTELARMSHCGKFQFEGDLLRGCVLACPEDACNLATRTAGPSSINALMATAASTSLACIILSRKSLQLDLKLR